MENNKPSEQKPHKDMTDPGASTPETNVSGSSAIDDVSAHDGGEEPVSEENKAMDADRSELPADNKKAESEIAPENLLETSEKPAPEADQKEPDSPETDEEAEKEPSKLYWILAVIVMFLLSLIPAWKVLSKINTHYLGGGELEGWLWRYWWFKEMMGSLWSQPNKDWGMLIYTYLCAGNYPETGNVFDWQTFSLALEPIFGDPSYYNIKIISILFCNGIAGYALTKYLTKQPFLAMIGGAVLILNPYVAYEIGNGRPRQIMLFSLPLFVMYLFDNYKTLKLRPGLLAGFWLGVSAAIYLFYGMSALFFGLMFVIIQLYIDHKKFTFTFAKYIVIMMLLFIMISGPFSFRYIEIVLKKEKLPETSYGRDFPHLDFLLQKNVQVDQRDPLAQSLLRYHSDSVPVFYPFRLKYVLNIPLIISLFALIPLLFVRPIPWLWFLTFFFFYVLSLGPYLRYGLGDNNYVRIAEGRPIPLLYAAFFKYVPFFSRLFAPIRMMGMMYVCISALLITNLDFIIKRIRSVIKPLGNINRSVFNGITAIIFLLAITGQMLYAGQIPVAISEISYPDVYDDMAKSKENFGVIELPFRVGDYGNYYQMYHGKKVLWGWTYGSIPTGFPKSKASFLSEVDPIKDNSFVMFLEELNRQPEKPPEFNKQDLRRLVKMSYKYLILHERGCREMDPEHGDLLYDYLVVHLTKSVGKPLKTGYESMKWQIYSPHGPEQNFRIAVFEINTDSKKSDK